MSDYFSHLADRVLLPDRVLQPHVGGLFETIAATMSAEQTTGTLIPSAHVGPVRERPGSSGPRVLGVNEQPDDTADPDRFPEDPRTRGPAPLPVARAAAPTPPIVQTEPPSAFREHTIAAGERTTIAETTTIRETVTATRPSHTPPGEPDRQERLPSTIEQIESRPAMKTAAMKSAAAETTIQTLQPLLPAPRAPFAPPAAAPEVLKRLAPAGASEAIQRTPDVHITIGRVDVRAVTQPSRERPRAATPRALTLDEVLAQRGRP